MWLFIVARYGLSTTGGYNGAGSIVWLGATDVVTENTFLWVPAGTPLQFEDWDNGQPNNFANQDCAAYIYGTKWHDVSCDVPADMAVCEGWYQGFCSSRM